MQNLPNVKADGATCRNKPVLKRQTTVCYISAFNMFYLSKLYSVATE